MRRFIYKLASATALIAAAALPVYPASDQTVTLTVEPGVIRLNESATLKLNFINLNPPQAPAAPQIPGFSIQYVGQESRFNMVNGAQSRQMTYNYKLVPRATGKFSIGPFTLNLGGQDTILDAATLEVLPAANTAGGGSQTMSDLVFAKIILPRERVYIQERFNVELLLYYRGVQLDRGIQLQNLPSTGLNLDNFEEIGSSREVVNNEIYQVRRFRMRGTALSSGSIELNPSVRINVLTDRRSRDPFESFFSMRQTETLSVQTEPVNVTILPLPNENKPENFSGAVGRFNLGVEVQPTECRAGDPVTLTLRLTGSGNFETISMPPLSLGDDFRTYDPKLISSGPDHKVFEQVFIPRSDEITEIPRVDFTYFDPDAAVYKTLSKGPLAITVEPGIAGAQQLVQAPSSEPAAEKDPLGIDIIDIKRGVPQWRADRSPGLPGVTAVVVHTAPVLAIGLLALFMRQRDAINRDVKRRRQTMAPKAARASIQRAETALASGNAGDFYESIWQAMANYIGHRANLKPGEVSPSMILKRTQDGGLPEELHRQLSEILTACEASRFASMNDQDEDALKEVLNQTQQILRACERIKI